MGKTLCHPVIGVLAVVMLSGGLLSAAWGQGQAANPSPLPDGLAGDLAASALANLADPPSLPAPAPESLPDPASATLNLEQLARENSIGEADNLRWSLVQDTPAGSGLFDQTRGVDWKALRQTSQSGSIQIQAGKSWSFNSTYANKVGYKFASGVYAGGHCALATVFSAAAHRGGLSTSYWRHWWPIPGFSTYESVSIWWGKNDLVIYNSNRTDISLEWKLTPTALTVELSPAAPHTVP